MSEVERLAARMICAGFTQKSLPHLEALIDRGLGGAVLFARNVTAGPDEVAAMCARLKRRAGDRPLWIGIDQEGGRVRRLREGFTQLPSIREVGALGGTAQAATFGKIVARELRACNIDVDFAPCVDVDTNPANPVIADRSFGADPARVSELGVAMLTAIQAEGVAACAKHFPGHGDTAQDSHHDLPRLDHGMERLEAVELQPFRACIDAGVASIMTAHVIFSPIDAERPATMSRPVLTGILREKLGFNGVVITDDLEMGAVRERFDFDDVIRSAVLAGVDVLTICHSPEKQDRAIEVIVEAVQQGIISEECLRESSRRLDVLCERFVKPAHDHSPAALFATPAHEALRREVEALGSQEARPDPTAFALNPTG
jgi:beta-N-acetylhexosaminidase